MALRHLLAFFESFLQFFIYFSIFALFKRPRLIEIILESLWLLRFHDA